MQRLVPLGMLAAIFGGGWMFLNGLPSAEVGVDPAAGPGRVAAFPPQGAPAFDRQPSVIGQPRQPAVGGLFAPQHTPARSPAAPPLPAATPVRRGPAAAVTPPPAGVLRIASFNIEVFGNAKANKEVGADGRSIVMAYLAATVQNFDLVAIQEIRTKDQYFIRNWLRDYVNQGGRHFDAVVGERLGRTSSKEQYAFLYDTVKVELNPRVVYTVQDSPEDLLHREPLVAMFRARGVDPQRAFTFMLVNTHTDPDETDTELDALAQVYEAVRRQPIGEDDVILLGDLNTAVPSSPVHASPRRGREITRGDLRGLGRIPGLYPLIRNQSTNVAGTLLHDNLLINTRATTEFTGRAGVFDIGRAYGLTRKQVDLLSDHLPVWAEFSVYESAAPGRVATGARHAQR